MITTTLRGGLGNQMFMYAMVRAMAIRNKTSMTFNLREGFDNDSQFHRKLELQHLNVNMGEKNPFAVFDYRCARYVQFLSRKTGRNIFLPQYKIIEEKMPLHFQSELIDIHIRNAYLEGYWQCEKYFEDVKEHIRNDFEIKTPMPDYVKVELDEIRQGNQKLVFIGVRRYQECMQLRPGMLLDADYYNKAIEYVENKIPNVKFVVFTQQRDWARQNLKSKSPIVFAHAKSGEIATIEDLYLMTHCDHAIISNSSFYWWGAWLINEKGKIVVSPNNFINTDTPCKEWVIL